MRLKDNEEEMCIFDGTHPVTRLIFNLQLIFNPECCSSFWREAAEEKKAGRPDHIGFLDSLYPVHLALHGRGCLFSPRVDAEASGLIQGLWAVGPVPLEYLSTEAWMLHG